MAIEREELAEVLKEVMTSMRGPEPHVVAAEKKLAAKHSAKRDELEKSTKQTKTTRFYRTTQPCFVTSIGLVGAGKVIEVPKDVRPSHTWEAVKTQKQLDAAAEAEAEEEAQADKEARELQDDDDPAPAGGKKPAPAGGKKPKRAADQDVG